MDSELGTSAAKTPASVADLVLAVAVPLCRGGRHKPPLRSHRRSASCTEHTLTAYDHGLAPGAPTVGHRKPSKYGFFEVSVALLSLTRALHSQVVNSRSGGQIVLLVYGVHFPGQCTPVTSAAGFS